MFTASYTYQIWSTNMKNLATLNSTNDASLAGLAGTRAGKSFKHTAILGLGNELLGDKGLGVHAIRQLKKSRLPETVNLVEVGTAVLDTLLALKYAERIIVLDAMTAGGKPGTLYRVPLDHWDGSPCIATMHGFEIFREMVLAARKRKNPLPIMVFGVEPDAMGWSMTLSPAVSNSIPSLIEAIREELQK